MVGASRTLFSEMRCPPMPTHRFAVVFLLISGACAAPRAAMTLSPNGHGQLLGRPAAAPIAWRSNALAAPCALQCHDPGESVGIACTCHALDSIYFSHLEQTVQAHAGNADVSAQVVAD